ncbi:MAG: HAMP domain-containing protein [Deltaproteobacteria bacterium]|nr:HAMP domain-containing protein [Deltaproteobacteria bacterium]
MKIRTQFIITMLLFGMILVIIAVSAINTSLQVEKASRQERIAAGIAQGASELSYLANDYLIYRESQQLSRWQSRFASFSNSVASLNLDKPEQQALVRNIQANKTRLKEVFDSAVSAVVNSPGNQKAVLDPALLQISWSRMAVQSQGLVSDASRLSHLLHVQMDRFIDIRTWLMYAMVGLLGVFLLGSYLLTYRRILKSLATLQAGTAIIGSGDLDFRIEEKKQDEIGELAHAFNRMGTDLKSVMASKEDLEREINERKKAEEALMKAHRELQEHSDKVEAVSKELESFNYSVSHDLRSPLRAIAGFTRMILNEKGATFDPETRRKFGIVEDNAQKMGRLIDDLLRLSRLGRAELNWSKVDMKGLVGEVLQEIRTTEPERKFTAEIGDLPSARGDQTMIRQLLANLISNAVKFTRGKPEGRIEVGSFEQSGEQVYYVKDNGIGFDMKYYNKVFGIFQRLVSESQFEGTGVGLAIVQRIAQRHGGRVWAEGKINEGATFYFTIPVRLMIP